MTNDGRLLRIPAGREREPWLELLRLADDSEQQVRSYMNDGDLYAYRDGDNAVGIVLVIPQDTATAELKSVAVHPSSQGKGIGQQMLRAVLDDLRDREVSRVIVGTASSAIGALAFYQKAGFRLLRIERDYFNQARGYPAGLRENGIAIRDMVWMDQPLEPRR